MAGSLEFQDVPSLAPELDAHALNLRHSASAFYQNEKGTESPHDVVRRREIPMADNTEKDPKDWVSGDDPTTGAQESYLKTFSEQAAAAERGPHQGRGFGTHRRAEREERFRGTALRSGS
jgi:hypothetical protein